MQSGERRELCEAGGKIREDLGVLSDHRVEEAAGVGVWHCLSPGCLCAVLGKQGWSRSQYW
jgi:hypothetical protein